MLTFKDFISEAWTNEIGKSSKEASVTSKTKYSDPKDFKQDSHKIGNVHGIEVHATGDGKTHFTWNPSDRLIHHVVHAAERTGNRLKYLSAHKREGSPVSMGDVYKHLVKHHNLELTGTGHSPGAQKMWSKFHDDKELAIHGEDPTTGETKRLSKEDPHYAHKGDPTADKRVGKMHLILKKS